MTLSGRASSNEQELAARYKIPEESAAGRAAFRDKVMQSQVFDTERYRGSVDRNPSCSDSCITSKLYGWVLESSRFEHELD